MSILNMPYYPEDCLQLETSHLKTAARPEEHAGEHQPEEGEPGVALAGKRLVLVPGAGVFAALTPHRKV